MNNDPQDEYDAPALADSIAKHDNLQEDISDYPIGGFPTGMMSHPYLGMLGGGGSAAEEGTEAKAGQSLSENSEIADQAAVISALKNVFDPEIPVNIYDLGLIYEHRIDENGDCDVLMTLTAPACPVAGEMPSEVANEVAKLDGIGCVTVTLTWSPPWDQSMMSEDAKLALDIW